MEHPEHPEHSTQRHYVVLTIMPDGERISGEIVYDDVEKALARCDAMREEWHKAHDALKALAELKNPLAAMQLACFTETCPTFVACELIEQSRIPVEALPKLDGLRVDTTPPSTA